MNISKYKFPLAKLIAKVQKEHYETDYVITLYIRWYASNGENTLGPYRLRHGHYAYYYTQEFVDHVVKELKYRAEVCNTRVSTNYLVSLRVLEAVNNNVKMNYFLSCRGINPIKISGVNYYDKKEAVDALNGTYIEKGSVPTKEGELRIKIAALFADGMKAMDIAKKLEINHQMVYRRISAKGKLLKNSINVKRETKQDKYIKKRAVTMNPFFLMAGVKNNE